MDTRIGHIIDSTTGKSIGTVSPRMDERGNVYYSAKTTTGISKRFYSDDPLSSGMAWAENMAVRWIMDQA